MRIQEVLKLEDIISKKDRKVIYCNSRKMSPVYTMPHMNFYDIRHGKSMIVSFFVDNSDYVKNVDDIYDCVVINKNLKLINATICVKDNENNMTKIGMIAERLVISPSITIEI